jgi:hypothetical protein
MKTLRHKKTGEIKRLNDKEAHKLVIQSHLGWEYCSKSELKTQKPKTEKKETNTLESSTLSDKKVRKQRREEKRIRHEQNNK